MVDRKVVPFDEFYYQLKLMYLFLLHVVYVCSFFNEMHFKLNYDQVFNDNDI
jgi:hypothetical protein